MKKVLGLTVSLLLAAHAWADDKAGSHEPSTDIVADGDCSLGLGRPKTLPEVAVDDAIDSAIVLFCWESGRCVWNGLVGEVTNGPGVSAVQPESWRSVELDRRHGVRGPRRLGSGKRPGGVSAWWR